MRQETKDRLLRIPVIGQLAGLAALPRKLKELDALRADSAALRAESAALQAETAALQADSAALQARADQAARTADERWQAATDTFNSLGDGIRGLQDRAEHMTRLAEERWESAAGSLAALTRKSDETQNRTETIREELDFDKNLNRLMGDGKRLSALRTSLSIHPALWGPADRLHISPDAYVDPCMLNTNSGSITVGAYTFAGPGASLIAGSHDPRLRDFPRRDLSPEAGYDIVIGRGVWLCANCTVLGPCRIGDHAVIAAGAVVVPGTEVEPGSIYGGVPAKKIGETGELPAEETLPGRFGDCLFTEGWYTAETIRTGDGERTGHWMVHPEAEIVCRPGGKTLAYSSPLAEGEDRRLHLAAGTWETEIPVRAAGEIRIPAEALPAGGAGRLRLKISRMTEPVPGGDPRSLGLYIWQREEPDA